MRVSKFILISITPFLLHLISCSSTQVPSSTIDKGLIVIASNYSPLVRASGQPKGMKIGIQVITNQNIKLDSIQYEGLFNKVEEIKKNQDTVWIMSHFYPAKTLGNSPVNEFTANHCELFFQSNQKPKSIKIENMKLVNSNTFWE
ncbi:MAG: hypothetical protein ACPGVC_07200 [Salibacteraceae bacterium]